MGRNLHGRVVCMHSQPTPLGRPGRLGRVCSTVLLAQQANREPNAVCPAATSDFQPNQPNEKASFASLIVVVRRLKFQTDAGAYTSFPARACSPRQHQHALALRQRFRAPRRHPRRHTRRSRAAAAGDYHRWVHYSMCDIRSVFKIFR